MDWGLLISVVALLFTGYTYIVHDRKIKKQEKIINEYNIKKNEREEIENKKACVRANMVKKDKGKYAMKIYNSGKSEANDVEVTFLSELEGFIVEKNCFVFKQILPHESAEFVMFATEGHEDSVGLKICWSDSNSTSNEFTQHVNVPRF